MSHSIHKLKVCPTCKNGKWDWLIWCSKCETVHCSNCLEPKKKCSCGNELIPPGR